MTFKQSSFKLDYIETKWLGGKYRGWVKKNSSKKYSFVLKCKGDDGKSKILSPYVSFYIDNYSSEQAAKMAIEHHRRRECLRFRLFPTNLYRYVFYKGGLCIEMRLTKGYTCIFDTEYLNKIKQYTWCVSKMTGSYTKYVTAYVKGQKNKLYMQQLLTDFKYKVVDHINRNGLDNRKCNLKDGGNSKNQLNRRMRSDNTSGHNGISWVKKKKDGNLDGQRMVQELQRHLPLNNMELSKKH